MIHPQEIRSTPAAATSNAVATVTRPDASVTARASTRLTGLGEGLRVHVVEKDCIGANV